MKHVHDSFLRCATSSPTAATPESSSPSQAVLEAQLSRSFGARRPTASRYCPGAGWWSGPLPGSCAGGACARLQRFPEIDEAFVEWAMIGLMLDRLARPPGPRHGPRRAGEAVMKHVLSPEGETNMANSRETWPLRRGFDRWFGFHGGETHQFVPALFHDNHAVRPPRSLEEGYHLSADLADRAIEYLGDLRAVDDQLPFFLYFATGACHSPHHAPAEWIERYKGRFRPGLGRLA